VAYTYTFRAKGLNSAFISETKLFAQTVTISERVHTVQTNQKHHKLQCILLMVSLNQILTL